MPGNSNSGRRADWFREVCADILDQEKLVEFVGRVAAGKETEDKLIQRREGGHEIIKLACDASTRLQAFKMLAEWGVGKPVQYVASASKTPEDSVRSVQQMLDLVKAASARPVIVVPDAAAAKALGETKGNGGNGVHS